MLRIDKDKLKSFILTVLIMSSFVQVGFLWDYQTHRLPFNFMSYVFTSSKAENKKDIAERARKEVYSPYRLSISNGNETHWLIEENDEKFHDIFDETNEYLRKILTGLEGSYIDENLWSELILKKSIMIEFNSGIKPNLLKWFLNIKGSSGDNLDSIKKILMLPDEDINNNNTIYILSSKGLLKYIIPFNKNGLSKRDYSKIINHLENETSLVQYQMFKEIDPNNAISNNLPFSIPKDALCIVGTKYINYPMINYIVRTKTLDTDELATIILGNEKESFDRYIESNAIVFRNINNTYRLYNNGLLEYKYTPGVEEQEKGDIGNAFEKVYFFIDRIKDSFIDPDNKLYLKNINYDNSNYYEFVFDYKVNGLPAYVSFDSIGKDNEPLNHALIIKVDSKKIVECRWYIIDIEKDKVQMEYNVHFQSMLDEFIKKYGWQELDKFHIKNITRAYLINNGLVNNFSPVWIIENSEGKYYYTNLIRK